MATIINTESGLSGKTPGFSVTSDVSGTLQLQTNSNTAVTIDSSQNVGIGTTSPVTGYRLSLYDATNGASNISGLVLIEPGASTSYSYFKTTSQASSDTRTIIGNSSVSRALAFETGGTERARIDSSGNLGLGVTPSAWGSGIKAIQFGLGANVFGSTSSYNNTNIVSNMYYNSGGTAIYQGSDYASFYQQVSGQHKWFNAASGTAGNAITFTQAMTLDASGNLGVGVTTVASDTPLHVKKTGDNALLKVESSAYSAILNLINGGATEVSTIRASGSNNVLTFQTGTTERARIDSSGNLLVGTTSQGTIGSNSSFGAYSSGYIGVSSTGDSAFSRRSSDGAVITLRRDTTSVGAINVTTTSTAYVTSSDYRLKNTIAPMTGALAKVAQLKPVTYKWNADGSDGEGFIAHELAEVCPHAVSGQKDAVDADGNPKYQGIDTSFLVATLTAAIQEQQALITQLQADVAALKGASA